MSFLAAAAHGGVSPEMVSRILLSGAILLGAALCFFGLRFFKVTLGVAGFAGGALLAAYFALKMTSPLPPPGAHAAPSYVEVFNAIMNAPATIHDITAAPNPVVLSIWAVSGGVAGAVLSVLLEHVGVFVLGMFLGVLVARTALMNAGSSVYMSVTALLGLIGGIVALVYRKGVVILSTALGGSFALSFAVYALIRKMSALDAANSLRPFGRNTVIVLASALVLGALGAFVQYRTSAKPKGGAASGKDKKPAKPAG